MPALLLVVRAPLAELSGVLSGDETLMVVRALSRAVSVRIRWWSPVKVLDDQMRSRFRFRLKLSDAQVYQLKKLISLTVVGGGFGGLDRSRLNPVKWLPLVKNGLSVKTVSLRFPV
ncbi:hypothetical protein F2Q69_00010063 [Brassica cretica]|uniref:Uncharacterized protein n=1 Tax=Brassica cretica TaxID=69181 RepID=A0A8S9P387_BRACR|nr:hypothetical protein F2Q69_00010063 [Brassica cretica]